MSTGGDERVGNNSIDDNKRQRSEDKKEQAYEGRLFQQSNTFSPNLNKKGPQPQSDLEYHG